MVSFAPPLGGTILAQPGLNRKVKKAPIQVMINDICNLSDIVDANLNHVAFIKFIKFVK
jgi:hypothetical protein